MKVLPALLSQVTFILASFNFRMASNKSLNTACNLDGYLFCKMPVGALEVEVKVKPHGKNSAWSKTFIPGEKSIMHGKRLMEGAERGKHPARRPTCRLKIIHLKQMCQQIKGLGIPLKSSQTPHIQQQCPTQRKKEKQNRKVNSWASIVNFVIDVVKPIVGVILLIGKKEC